MIRFVLPFVALVLVACTEPPANTPDPVARGPEPQLSPPEQFPDLCWDSVERPATIQTITRKVLVTPAKVADDGSIQTPPEYRDETTQEIVTPRSDDWFEVPCPDQLTREFIASVQRALLARGFETGPPTGQLSQATRDAIQAYQKDRGLRVGPLTVETAQTLGLWAVAPPQ